MLMSDVHSWRTLFNPFSPGDMPGTGRVSGRSTDIRNLIANQQSAIILSGSPRVGKTAFVRYLKGVSSVGWSWRDEVSLHDLREQFALGQLYFTQIDLTTLENAQSAQELLTAFVAECKRSLDTPYDGEKLPSLSHDIKGLRSLLRYYAREFPEARYFVMLDAVERLARLDMTIPELEGSLAQTPQERGIALLNHCGAIRVLVDLIDEFANFGVIFSIQSLARPRPTDQFIHVSADLARFTTTVLQCLTHTDALAFWVSVQRILVRSGRRLFTSWVDRKYLRLTSSNGYMSKRGAILICCCNIVIIPFISNNCMPRSLSSG